MFLSFEDKVMFLATINSISFTRAVGFLANIKRKPVVIMREALDNLARTHYLLGDGIVEITTAGVLQFVELICPQQPKPLTKEYFESCPTTKQEAMQEAFAVLKCSGMLRNFKPYAVVYKERVRPRFTKVIG